MKNAAQLQGTQEIKETICKQKLLVAIQENMLFGKFLIK